MWQYCQHCPCKARGCCFGVRNEAVDEDVPCRLFEYVAIATEPLPRRVIRVLPQQHTHTKKHTVFNTVFGTELWGNIHQYFEHVYCSIAACQLLFFYKTLNRGHSKLHWVWPQWRTMGWSKSQNVPSRIGHGHAIQRTNRKFASNNGKKNWHYPGSITCCQTN
jgi:hypothetical protein